MSKHSYLALAEGIPDREPGVRRKNGGIRTANPANRKKPNKVELLQGNEAMGYNEKHAKWYTTIVADGRRSRYYNEARNKAEALVEKNRFYAELALQGATFWVKPSKVKPGKVGARKALANHTKLAPNIARVRVMVWRYKAYAPDGKCIGTFDTRKDAEKARKGAPARKSPTKLPDPVNCDFCGEPATYRINFPGDPWNRRLVHECAMNTFLSLKRRPVLAVKEWNTSGHKGTPSKSGLHHPELLTAFKRELKCAGCGCEISKWRYNTFKSCLACEKKAIDEQLERKAAKQQEADY